MPSSPMRLFRPDFQTIFKDLPRQERSLSVLTMNEIYDTITGTVDGESLDQAGTARLVKKSVLALCRPDQCYQVIMQAIWPQIAQLPVAHPGGSHRNSTMATPPDGRPISVDPTNSTTQMPPSVDPPTPASPGSRPSSPQLSSSSSIENTVTQADDPSIPNPPGLSPSSHELPSSGSIDNDVTQTLAPSDDLLAPLLGIGHHPLGLVPGRGVPRGQASLRGHGRGGHRGGHRGGGHHGGGTTSTQTTTTNYQFTRRINDFPLPSGRDLQRTFGFTELSPPDAEMIILGPLPPPTLPPHVLTSTLPPSHPPQSYGPGAFPPNHNIPATGESSGNSDSGTTSEIREEEVASALSTEPVVSPQSPDSEEKSKKRSRDDQDDEEEKSRPSIRLRIEAPPQSSQPDDTTADTAPVASSSRLAPSEIRQARNEKKRARDDQDDEEETSRPSIRLRIEAPPQPSSIPDDTTADASPVASSSTFAPSKNNEGSKDNGSPKKRARDPEEDEEESARPSTRMRHENAAVRPRYPSPTPYDRRVGRIIAPFGKSIRFNPRPSPEPLLGSLEVAHNEGNLPDNSPASSSGSSSLPLTSSEPSPSTRSSQRIKEREVKKTSKKA